MNKKILIAVSLVMAIVFVSCNKNMKALDASYFKTTPNPLEEKAGKVDATVTGTFPVKYFNKKAVVTVTPVMKFNGEEVKGQSSVFQGEKILDNNQKIAYKAGGTYTMKPSFFYIPEMAKSELYLNFDVVQKKKNYTLPAVKIADGVLATSELVAVKDIKPALIADKFQRITQENQNADILFLIQQAQLRNSELKAEDVKAFTAKVKEARDAQNKEVTSLEVLGYASPDGAVDLNTNLAEKRQKVTKDYVNKELKKLKSNVTVDSKFTAEDWEGFQNLMESSNIQDKDLILRVLSMYQDPEQREREIKNLSTTFKTIATDILPQLRRSRMKLTVDVTGKSDEQIAQLAATSPADLTVEELLYAATLTKTETEKAAIYQKVISLYPTDARGYNNLGLVNYEMGKIAEAQKLYEKALEIDRSRAIIYRSLAKSLYLDNKRDMAIHNYIIGLSISIIYYANQHGYEQSDIENEHVQNHLVSRFFSTNRHLAHAYIDLYPTQIENLIKNIEQENSSLTRSQVQQIVNYEISNYRFGLAGGGLKDEPSHHDIDHNLNFIHIYQKCGEKIAMDYIDWNSIQLN